VVLITILTSATKKYKTFTLSYMLYFTPDQTSVHITNAFIPQKCAPPI
jgi:hypothetical protein